MNPRQRAFAERFAVHHNGARAAEEAGYSKKRLKQTARDQLMRPDVRQLIAELDAETSAVLGIDAQDVADMAWSYVKAGLEGGVPATAGVRSLELLASMAGLTRPEPQGPPQQIVFSLNWDRDLE